MQVGMQFLSEVIAGALFPGKPFAVLTCMVYGRQILEQNLNLISDYKFGFYMKIPEKEMFIGQVYGTLLGPFINYGMMRKSSPTLFFKALTDHVQRLHHQQRRPQTDRRRRLPSLERSTDPKLLLAIRALGCPGPESLLRPRLTILLGLLRLPRWPYLRYHHFHYP
jgi:hypothetical protein